jgi:hypothetical protein
MKNMRPINGTLKRNISKILRLGICFIFSALLAEPLSAGEKTAPTYPSKKYAFVRIFKKARKDLRWKAAQTLSYRIRLVRNIAEKDFSTVSDPVSDRYMITCYGGPVDLVHCLGLAMMICGGENPEEALFKQWEYEGGWENLKEFNYRSPPEAHPDDLPSNALGALWGSEIRKNNKDMSFDLLKSFEEFITPFIPVPDCVARHFSHKEIVMGLPSRKSKELEQKRQAYFTAEPLVNCRKINRAALEELNRKICENAINGREALKIAGFCLVSYKGRPIIIERRQK